MNDFDQEHAEEERTEIDLTPMLDVVFILLIFFIVTAVFIRQPGIEVTRPKAGTAFESTVSVYVAISPENEIWLAGNRVEPESLRFQIERLHDENPGGGLIILADEGASNQYALAVMDAARAAGISSVALVADRP